MEIRLQCMFPKKTQRIFGFRVIIQNLEPSLKSRTRVGGSLIEINPVSFLTQQDSAQHSGWSRPGNGNSFSSQVPMIA